MRSPPPPLPPRASHRLSHLSLAISMERLYVNQEFDNTTYPLVSSLFPNWKCLQHLHGEVEI